MEIEVKGHSGCSIDLRKEGDKIFVYKSTRDPKYLNRLALQAKKQIDAIDIDYYHIRIPEIYDVCQTDTETTIKMQYVYSRNFVEFFEQAGFEQIGYFSDALKHFIEFEINKCKLQVVPASIFQEKFKDIEKNIRCNSLYEGNEEICDILMRSQDIFDKIQDMELPVGTCHGDLTFSNILFNGNNYFLIDFLDSFIETPLQDIVKIRQDTAYRWSQLMYKKPIDSIRLKIICDKIDFEIDSYFRQKYGWYRQCYPIMQLMNMLRILPYATDVNVINFLITIINKLLANEDGDKENVFSSIDTSINPKESDRFSVIVPIAADKIDYEKHIPAVFKIADDGTLLCVKSILGMDLTCFQKVYFTILKKYDERYSLTERLLLQFKIHGLKNAEIVVLDKPTSSQPETIYQTIKQKGITGSIFIKDADCYMEGEISKQNSSAIYPLESLKWVNPQDKSYVSVDDMFYVTNIIEKRIVSHYFTAGGYCFESAEQYQSYYERFAGQKGLYLSHIIYAMLLNGHSFRPIRVNKYIDYQKDLKQD